MNQEELRNWALYGGLSLGFTILCVVLALGPGMTWVVDKAVQRLPLSVEDKLGGELMGSLVKKSASKDPGVLAALSRCAQALAEPGEERKYQVFLIEDAELNAFALPGGHLVIHRGLLGALKDQHELMAVLGHEAGHVRQRHFLRRLARAGSLGVGFAVLFGDSSGLAGLATDLGAELLQRGYSRKEEEEADDAGLATLARLGMDVHGAERAMQRLLDAHPGSALPEILSTHPDTASRRDRLRAKAKGLAQGHKALLTDDQWQRLKKEPAKHGPKAR